MQQSSIWYAPFGANSEHRSTSRPGSRSVLRYRPCTELSL